MAPALAVGRNVQDQKISVQLKDAMRDNCIEDIAEAWYKLILKYYTSNLDLTTLVLQTLQKYISWMSIGLVMNNKYGPLILGAWTPCL